MQTALLQHHLMEHIGNPKARKQELLERLKSFSDPSDLIKDKGKIFKLNEIRLLVEKIFDAKTLTFEINVGGSIWMPFFTITRLLEEEKQKGFENLRKDVEHLLLDVGYRENVSTWQEYALTGGAKWIEHPSYASRGVLAGEITVAEAKKARELLIITEALSEYYGLEDKGYSISVLYELLDDKGETARTPRPVDKKILTKLLSQNVLVEEAIERSMIRSWKKSQDFPEDHDRI